MIANIIDSRKKKFRWKTVNAIVEATWQDNSCSDSDQAEEGEAVFDERKGISVHEAIDWASNMTMPVTLYLSDSK
ncbi:hypothetical protein [Gimibacter soli]|uniref:Uncharacterized protein n=1 Tax=Gimibacter soli TaxID=3024400 RepID=A0AAE9XQV9_9PROT|nr:hypothetical protein [Gimibacter soli]WCL53230.1 hypothetical protein PH603_11860 [Gimibacter soli]